MHRLKVAWNDYFGGNLEPTIGPGEIKTRQTPSASSVYVSNCLFNKVRSSDYGGALYCSTSVTYLLVESSSFFSCSTSSNYGGAIYFSNTNSGECVLYGVCGNDCCSTYAGTSYSQFAAIYVKNDALSKNCINYSSIARCVNVISTSRFTLRIENGKILWPSVNISMSKCTYYTGILCYAFTDLSSTTCLFSYSSFADNIASGHICIGFNRNAKYEMKSCNIIRNSQDSTSYGIIYSTGNTIFEDSCILENRATNIFHQDNSQYTITLSNCTVDKTANNGYLTIQNTVTKSFILGLNHMSTQNCHSEYDSAGTLTAIPYVSPSTKKVIYYTFNHCQARISAFFSITWFLIFTFIHPNPY
jgi:hypothetical protein